MRYVDEFRDPRLADGLLRGIRERTTRTWNVMEVCGGQTHTLIRSGIDELVSGSIQLIHGPGCPVCVTPLEKIDRALAIARRKDSILCSYGDMLRVPGSSHDLLTAKANGADVRIVYSPVDAVKIACENPDREVVFFAVGFETTAPANAMAVKTASLQGIENFSVIVSHVRVPPAISLILADPDCQVNGFIAPGHVCSVMGYSEYEELSERHGVPFVVAGFEPLDLLQGLHMLTELLEDGRGEVGNQYTRSVRRQGNESARRVMEEVFSVADMAWRGIGEIPMSGLQLADAYRRFDAETRFDVGSITVTEPELCISGEVLRGRRRPTDCAAFGRECTPESPLGAPMVSNEGACSAYYAFRRQEGVGHGV
jgi:hydrogenase expression/formation protein HypD